MNVPEENNKSLNEHVSQILKKLDPTLEPTYPPRYTGEFDCPQCGCGSKDLVASALPVIIRRFGNAFELVCDICEKGWLHVERRADKPQESGAASTTSTSQARSNAKVLSERRA